MKKRTVFTIAAGVMGAALALGVSSYANLAPVASSPAVQKLMDELNSQPNLQIKPAEGFDRSNPEVLSLQSSALNLLRRDVLISAITAAELADHDKLFSPETVAARKAVVESIWDTKSVAEQVANHENGIRYLETWKDPALLTDFYYTLTSWDVVKIEGNTAHLAFTANETQVNTKWGATSQPEQQYQIDLTKSSSGQWKLLKTVSIHTGGN